MNKFVYDPKKDRVVHIDPDQPIEPVLYYDSDGTMPEIYVSERCEYCGVISLEFDVCPHCGAPKS